MYVIGSFEVDVKLIGLLQKRYEILIDQYWLSLGIGDWKNPR